MAKLAPNGLFFCPGCERYELTEDDFYRDKSKKYGLSRLCKPCESERTAPAKHRHYLRSAKKKQINNRATKRRYYLANREDILRKNAEYKRQHPEQVREEKRVFKFRWRYAMTPAERQAMIEEQGGCCDICGSYLGNRLEVDHDHHTGKVRALLCGHCNKGLGLFRDSPELLSIAISYLHYYAD